MSEEQICTTCGRANPLTQPRCIHCGQRAQGTFFQPPENAVHTNPTTPWWQASTSSGGAIPTPPQVRAEIQREEAERRVSEEREAEAARRRIETARRIAETRERLAALKAAEAAAVAELAAETTATCEQCGVSVDEGFSFCLRCGADAKAKSARKAAAAEAKTSAEKSRTTVGVVAVAEPTANNQATPILPSLLSFFLPGFGQLVNRQISKGVVLLLATYAALAVFGYPAMGIPMLIVRIVAAVDAYRIAERRREGRKIREGEWDLG